MRENGHKMAVQHAPFINQNLFICIAVSLLLPVMDEAKVYEDTRSFASDEKRLSREYHLRQGALRGLIVKPSRQYDLQPVEMFLGVSYAAPPIGSLRFMPPVSAPPWSGLKIANRFAPVCPQTFPQIKKGNPPSLGRQHYLRRLKPFLKEESEDCLYLNIYVPYREQKSKKFPILVFIHGDSFEWSSGNPYDGRILASYGNVMVITVNFRLGVLGFMKPSLTEHVYGNNGLLDQLAALQWIKDNIEDLNGDPKSVTLMGHGTGAACVNLLMLSPISNGLFHRAILMSGSALSDFAMTKDPTQYTLQVAQGLGCNPSSKNMMTCLQNKPLSEIKKVQILSREFETPLGPVVAGSFIPSEPAQTMDSFPNLLSKYQLLSGVTELESYHDFGVIELDHGILENQRDDFIKKYSKIVYEGAEDIALKEILKQYSPSKVDPQRWSVETNRDVVLNLFSDARTLAPMISLANYQSKANRQSYFYVFGHNSVSTEYAPLNKSVHGEEMPYVLGVPLGGANTHFHSEYTLREKLLSEVVMRLWTNFVKNGSPNTQSVNEYYTLDRKVWNQYNVEWPEYNLAHQPYLRLDIPPSINSLYRSNYTSFWIEKLPNKLRKYVVDPLFAFTSSTTLRPKPPVHRAIDTVRKIWSPSPAISQPHSPSMPSYGKLRPYSPPQYKPDTDAIYKEIQSIKTPSRPVPPHLMEKHTEKPPLNIAKTSSTTVTLIISLAVLFLAVNVSICAVLYFKKRRLRLQTLERPSEIGEVDIIGQKSSDKSALQKLKNGCSVIKSMKIPKKKINKECKTPKSDDSGGFRERFQLRRHLSTSTLDAHTKVRDWITNEVMHRCSPNILRKSNPDVHDKTKPFTRSEELLTDKKTEVNKIEVAPTNLLSKKYRNKTSEKTTSTSALDSHSSIASNKKAYSKTSKSNESIKSKTESVKSKKVSVAIDATPAARTNSILKQEPIELSKSFDCIENGIKVTENKLQRSHTVSNDIYSKIIKLPKYAQPKEENKIYTNEVKLSLQNPSPLKISHKHSSSDPVTDVNYESLLKQMQRESMNILPPVTFRNEINVTSRDDVQKHALSPEEALLTIKRRNFPKVLPDLPKSQKRLSLQPNLQSFRGYMDSQVEKPKVPPQPPPRTTTLERRLAYKKTKILSSFDSPKKITENYNYENIDNLSPYTEVSKTRSLENRTDLKHFNREVDSNTKSVQREYPKVIIASSDISPEPKIIIKPSLSQVEIPTNVPRVRLPDDFHSGSITSFSSYCSEDDDDDIDEEEFEDKLIQELVGRVESPSEDVLDSKGPETILRKVEIVPVRLNTVQTQKSSDYVCGSDLFLPDLSILEQTAKIKPNFGLNKLKNRSESINRPPERAVKVKQKRRKPGKILNRVKSSTKSDSPLEHSTSGSSNDTETSTGTVKKVDQK